MPAHRTPAHRLRAALARALSLLVPALAVVLGLALAAPAQAATTSPVPDDVRAQLEAHWQELGGTDGRLGDPAGEPVTITDGYRWDFAGGALFLADRPEASVAAVVGNMLRRYDDLGAASGGLGWPQGDPARAETGGSVQEFDGGRIYASRDTGAHEVRGAILHRYLLLGGPARMGLPTSGDVDVPDAPDARMNSFERGRIYWSPGTGPREVIGAILHRYLLLGAASRIGLPTTGEIDVPGVAGARQNVFQGGRIYWSTRTGSREVIGAILGRYLRVGGPRLLGLPVTGEIDAGAPGARVNAFQRGRVYWSPGTGAREVRGGILGRYLRLRAERGQLGLPVTGELADRLGSRQHFQHGALLWETRARRAFIRLGFSAPANLVRRSDVPFTWRPGCPVGPAGLRQLHIVHRGWNGDDQVGTLVVNASVVGDIRAVFRRAYRAGFPIRWIVSADRWRGSDVQAMAHDATNAFNCRNVTGNPYRLSQHSYGNAIDINSVENPYVTGSSVYPARSRTFLNRAWARKGMILAGGPVQRAFAALGWPWGARWGHPDYQHFSSNGG